MHGIKQIKTQFCFFTGNSYVQMYKQLTREFKTWEETVTNKTRLKTERKLYTKDDDQFECYKDYQSVNI